MMIKHEGVTSKNFKEEDYLADLNIKGNIM